jgi:hypothetical protein
MFILRKNNDNFRLNYFYSHSWYRVIGIFSQSRRRLERRALVMSAIPQAAIIIGTVLLLWAGVCAFLIGADDGDDE